MDIFQVIQQNIPLLLHTSGQSLLYGLMALHSLLHRKVTEVVVKLKPSLVSRIGNAIPAFTLMIKSECNISC